MDKRKYEQKQIWFERPLLKEIRKAAQVNDTDAAKWIRTACREKLERERASRNEVSK